MILLQEHVKEMNYSTADHYHDNARSNAAQNDQSEFTIYITVKKLDIELL